MIKDALLAKQISDLMLDIAGRIDSSVASARSQYTPGDCAALQRAAAKVLSAIEREFLNPIFAEHPSLRPVGWTTRAEHPQAASRSLGGIIQPV